jgi:hypothetical protein
MGLCYLLLDPEELTGHIRPALAAAWRSRSFAPCRDLCAARLPRANEFAARYHLGADPPLLAKVVEGLPFDRAFWQHLVGELLWFCARAIPEVQTAEDSLVCLLAPGAPPFPGTPRQLLAPMQQAHRGSRDLVLGACYRPDYCGWSDAAETLRLADYLAAVPAASWRPDDLAALPDLPAEDLADELEYARACLASLADIYLLAAQAGLVVVCEEP